MQCRTIEDIIMMYIKALARLDYYYYYYCYYNTCQ